jgi:hypothetical protein
MHYAHAHTTHACICFSTHVQEVERPLWAAGDALPLLDGLWNDLGGGDGWWARWVRVYDAFCDNPEKTTQDPLGQQTETPIPKKNAPPPTSTESAFSPCPVM